MWNDLSMADRAKVIRLGVQSGITDLNTIREGYNSFAMGGPKYNKEERKWYNPKGEEIQSGHGYWSKGAQKYVMYGTDGSVTKYDPLEWAKKKNIDIRTRRKELERKYSIPVDNRVTLTQSGNRKEDTKDRGTQVSQQQVDSILKYANIVGIPAYEALGQSAQESTFNKPGGERDAGQFYDYPVDGGWYSEYIPGQHNRVSPVLMTSDWNYIKDNPYNDFIETVEKIKDPKKQRKKALEGRAYMDKQASKFRVDIPPLQHSLELYKSGKYNTKKPDYMNIVKRRGRNLRNSPEMVNMVNNSPFFF